MRDEPHESQRSGQHEADASTQPEEPATGENTSAPPLATARSRSVLGGIALVAGGVVLLAAQAGVIELSIGAIITRWWPVLVVVYGVGALLDRHYGEGAVVTAVGAVLLASTTGVGPDIGVVGLVAVALIGAGVATLAESMTRRSPRQE